jgi:hypothetical protein
MPRLNALCVAVLSLSVIGLPGCGHSDHAAATAARPRVDFAVLDAKDQPLRDDFNRGRGDVRLMFLVDPVCPGCLLGLSEMGNDLLSKLPKDAQVKAYVVYEPVIGGTAKDIPAAAALLKARMAHDYWNPSGAFGWQMSHVLGYWNGSRWVYARDTWLIYPPDAVWSGAAPPKPAFVMHQLGGLGNLPQYKHLDGKVFAAKVNGMLAAMHKNAAMP